jgi:hypothetical protein
MLTKKIQPEGQVDKSQRGGPHNLQGCNNHPHHPHHLRAMRAKAAPILPPTFTPEVRWQALIEAVKLRAQRQTLEHGCYTEKSGAR